METDKIMKFPYIEMKGEEVTDSQKAEAGAALEFAKQTFCMLWPVVVEQILILIEPIKLGWVKILINIGLGGINQLHNQICPKNE